MTQIVTAVYENGVYRPLQPPADPPAEGATVRLTVAPEPEPSPGQRTAAILRRIAAIRVETGPVETTSENVDAVLYGKEEPA